MHKALYGLLILPVILIIFLIPPQVGAEQTIEHFRFVVQEAQRAEINGEDGEEIIQKNFNSAEYRNTCTLLYHEWMELRNTPLKGDPAEIVNQLTTLKCLENKEIWDN